MFDGLDELLPRTLQALVPLFERIKTTHVHFAVFSRAHNMIINEAFKNVEPINIRAQQRDIRVAVKRWIERDQHMQYISSGDKTFEGRVAAGIVQKSAGL